MIKHIHSLFIKHNKVSTDTRNIIPNSIFFALKGKNFNANVFAEEALKKGAIYAIVDEQKYQTHKNIILVKNVLHTLQELAAFHRDFLKLPIIALTGSNGKTTTKELINTVLSKKYNTVATKGNLNNHIGVPLTLLSMTKDTEIGIVEMGANHPKEIEFLCNIAKPDFGYITNFGKAHLEGFGNLEGVIKAKTELYQYLKINNKIVFVNANDNTQIEKSINMQVISFGTEKSKYSIKLLSANPFVTMEFDNIIIESNMLGIYNYNNIAAAIAIGKHFNVNNNQIKQALEIYHPTNNRSQIINLEDKKIILDAYNANPSSMKSALENFIQLTDKNKIVILGDMFELGSYTEIEHQKITDFFNNNNFKHIYLLGGNFLKTTTNNKNITILKNYNSFEEHFDIVKFKNSTILIKASRGMALERIVNLFK